jgi:hypothetical protein
VDGAGVDIDLICSDDDRGDLRVAGSGGHCSGANEKTGYQNDDESHG